MADGLHVLSLEGLQMQYARNFELESRVTHNAQQQESFLMEHRDQLEKEMKERVLSGLLETVMAEYELSAMQLHEFYALNDALQAANPHEQEGIRGRIDAILGGIATKRAKRLRNIQALIERTRGEA
jgi:hypothetical protein